MRGGALRFSPLLLTPPFPRMYKMFVSGFSNKFLIILLFYAPDSQSSASNLPFTEAAYSIMIYFVMSFNLRYSLVSKLFGAA